MGYNGASFKTVDLRKKVPVLLSSFLIALNAVLPFLVYLGVGYAVHRIGLTDEPFLERMNKMVFQCFFPFLMFWSLYNVDDGLEIRGSFLPVCVLSLLLLVGALILAVPRLVKDRPKQPVVIQAAYRSNFVLFGIPMAQSVFGARGAAVATLMVAIIVPLYNAIAVILFETWRGGDIKPLQLLKNIVTNPLILGALVGLVFLLLGIKLPAPVETPISAFSALTTPLALFLLGGTLKFRAIRDNRRYLWPTMAFKLILLPLIATLLSSLFGFSDVERFGFLIMAGAPVAIASFPMAANMGGDGELAGQFVALSTVASLFTLFGFIVVYHTVGFIA
ncbi:MAG: AEC family transporter [Clostridia bacterium]|nr:AEC family transporter [Clostridia bacterium]